MLVGKKKMLNSFAVGAVLAFVASPAVAQVLKDDLVFGLNDFDVGATLELVRGPATEGGGAVQTDEWESFAFQQSVEFDNHNGIPHNRSGNMLSLNFGSSTAGGSIYNYATKGSFAGSALLAGGDFNTVIGHTSRIGGLSISPGNSKIAFTGYESGRVYVMDYDAGETPGTGAGASLNSPRFTEEFVLQIEDTTGTTWLDDNTVLTLDGVGKLITVDTTSGPDLLTATEITDLSLPNNDDNFTSLAYEPSLSPYVYAMWSTFSGVTTNTLYVMDPANFDNENPSDDVVATVDFSGSMDTTREIAFDSNGNLFVGQFGGLIDIIPGLGDMDPASITADSSVDWYDSPTFSQFNGLDVASTIGEAPPLVPGDFDGDGDVDGADFVVWQTNFPTQSGATLATGDADGDGDVDGADFVIWQTNFPFTPTPSSSAITPVPEPTTVVLMIGVALPAFTLLRRKKAREFGIRSAE